VRSAVTLLASLAGLTGYVYLTGGVLTWIRLTAARVPADALTAVIDQKVLFAVGLKAIVFAAGVFAAVCVVAYGAGRFGWKNHEREWHATIKKGTRKAAGLTGKQLSTERAAMGDRFVRTFAGLNYVVLSLIVGLSVSRVVELITPRAWVLIVTVVVVVTLVVWCIAHFGPLLLGGFGHAVTLAFALFVAFFAAAPIGVLVLSGVAITRLGRLVATVERPSSVAGLLRSPLPWALVTVYLLVAVSFVAQAPISFTRAIVTANGQTQTGGYLARTSDGVYLVECRGLADTTSRGERSVLIPAAGITSTTLGGESFRVDSGDRPSLATLVLRAAGIHASTPTWFRADLRTRAVACGGSSLPAGTADKALGENVLVGPAPASGRASGGEAPIAQTSPQDATLARRFQPTVEVTVADRFWPVSVASVLQDRGTTGYGLAHGGRRGTCLVRARKCVASPPTLADLSPVGAAADDSLAFPASPGIGNPTSEFQAFVRGQGLSAQTIENWLADPAALDPWRSAQVYLYDAGVSAYGARYKGAPSGLRSLQYWFFYPYNYYPTLVARKLMADAPLAADLANTDLHEGDWEHVTVLLDPSTLKPRYLYMARHDVEGEAVPWNDPGLRFDGEHPIVQAALGGHPTYPDTCAEHRRTIAPLNGKVSDWVVCGSGRFAFRAATTPLVDLAKASWACWPGHFGEATQTQIRNAQLPELDPRRAIAKYLLVAGPRSPLRQAENTHVCG
jgi:hypothetical protein